MNKMEIDNTYRNFSGLEINKKELIYGAVCGSSPTKKITSYLC